MPDTDNKMNIGARFSNINGRQLIYPGILIVVLVLLCMAFYSTVQFLSTNINSAFTPPSQSIVAAQTQIQQVDMQDYGTVLQKVAAGLSATSSSAANPNASIPSNADAAKKVPSALVNTGTPSPKVNLLPSPPNTLTPSSVAPITLTPTQP